MEVKSITEQKSLLDTLARASARACTGCCSSSAPATGPCCCCRSTRGSSTGRETSSPTRPPRTPSTSSISRPRPATRRSPARSASPRSTTPTTRAGPADPQGQRQDRRAALRQGALDLQRLGRGRGAPRRRRRRLHDVPRLAAPGRGPRSAAGVRQDCDRYGMPLVVWAYPRGAAIDKKGGQHSFYAIDYAARMAMEMGADVVKLNMPKIDPETDKDSPAPYNEGEFTQRGRDRAVRRVGRPLAGRALRRLEDRRREAARADALHHAGRRLGRDLRAQRLAARVERGARDRRADQGDHALQRLPDPVAVSALERPIREADAARLRPVRGPVVLLASVAMLLVAIARCCSAAAMTALAAAGAPPPPPSGPTSCG